MLHVNILLTTTPSAPIIWDKNNNKGLIVGPLIVNSGNANAHTGKFKE